MMLSCATEVSEVDPRVDYGDEPAYVPEGEPVLEAGYFVGRRFEALPSEGGTCPLIHGFQGGTWTMPTLRMRGVATEVEVSCSLASEAETYGEIRIQERFLWAPDSWVELLAFPVPAAHAPPHAADGIDDLYGLDAELACQVVDTEGRMATFAARCVLSES
jgi:hypothetical protein